MSPQSKVTLTHTATRYHHSAQRWRSAPIGKERLRWDRNQQSSSTLKAFRRSFSLKCSAYQLRSRPFGPPETLHVEPASHAKTQKPETWNPKHLNWFLRSV